MCLGVSTCHNALPQRNVSATGRALFAVANWKSVFVDCEYMLQFVYNLPAVNAVNADTVKSP